MSVGEATIESRLFSGRPVFPGTATGLAEVSRIPFDTCASFVDVLISGARTGRCRDVSNADLYDRDLVGCILTGNTSTNSGGAIFADDCSLSVAGCTMYGNTVGASGAGIYCHNVDPAIDNTIIAFSTAGEAIYCSGTAGPVLSCTDIYGNPGGDWIGCIAAQAGTNGASQPDPKDSPSQIQP